MSIELNPARSGSQFETPSVVVKGSDDYEFSVYEDSVLTTLASRMKLAGVGVIAFGVVHTLIAMQLFHVDPSRMTSALFAALISAILGALLLSSARQFRAIADTQGEDVTHLMTAIGRLSQFFLVQGIISALAVAVLALSLVLLTFASR